MVEGEDAAVLPDALVGGADLWTAGVALCAAGFALCAAGFVLALVEGAAAGWVAVLAEVLVVGRTGGVGVAGVVAPAGDATGIVVALEAPAGELPEPPVNTSASSTSASSAMSTSVHRRRRNWTGRPRGVRERRRGSEAAPIRPATPARPASPIRPDARLRGRGAAGGSPSWCLGRSPRRMEGEDGRRNLLALRLGRADRGDPEDELIGVPAIRPSPAPSAALPGLAVG
jgi:hypothetical protein